MNGNDECSRKTMTFKHLRMSGCVRPSDRPSAGSSRVLKDVHKGHRKANIVNVPKFVNFPTHVHSFHPFVDPFPSMMINMSNITKTVRCTRDRLIFSPLRMPPTKPCDEKAKTLASSFQVRMVTHFSEGKLTIFGLRPLKI